jgi:choline monooxygenase
MLFPFDPNIETASTLPARLYTDPVCLALEKERIFARTWQVVGRVDQLREDGAFVTTDIGDEPIVVTNDKGTLRGFHNVCLHRGGPVASGCGKRKTLQCKYHGWTYSLRGDLLKAPEMEGVAKFSPSEMRLHAIQVDTFGPLVLANLDPKAAPLATFLEDIPARTARFDLASMKYVTRRNYEVACNWKIYVDNYLEGYHVPLVHPGLHKELDYDAYRVDTKRYYSYQHAPVRASAPTYAGEDRVDYFWIFPNLMLNVYFGQMQTNVIVPLSHDRTLTIFEWYAASPPEDPSRDAEWTKLSAFSHEVQEEDIAICEAVQKNLRSRAYDRGRYSVKRENGVHHFHGLLHEFLG